MAKTKIEDIIVPEVFNPYVVQRTMELSSLYSSGIIQNDPALNALASSGGKIINMPYFNDLVGDDEVLSDDGALTPEKITTGQDQAVLLMRGKAWSVNDLAKALSGADPMAAIGDLVAGYWSRQMQKTLISVLTGVFSADSMSGNISDISAGTGDSAIINGPTFIDATQKLGDAKESLTAVAMHSATVASLAKKDLIETIRDSQGNIVLKSYMGKTIIEDDGCPVDTANGVYTTYLFGQGAVGYGNGNPPVPTETDRDTLAGDDILINRKHYILHPRGVKFTNTSVAGSSPTNTELATATNWERVYENKAIRIVEFKHKIA
ncbi:major capsid protein [Clostridium tyrobutyricum]|uniref:major capsid protein n=1 Tax=Clostridium tyrobutyricum TaxID=1519 RepID=UPI001C3922B7|nr:major capsid protein [Clostridium tyrobutyricum]MBV4427150.1 coat protein [Clostridium tyrobutyricum]MBV4442123.1 coat protein [Clostridium tyrobutyricum]MBV4442306.1 coat protein [Clostridium tyrobutyricum]